MVTVEDIMIDSKIQQVAVIGNVNGEALLASTTVDDTPEKESSSKSHKRIFLQLKSPQTNSRRKRRIQKSSPVSNPVSVLNLGDDDDDVEASRPGHIAGKDPQIESLKEKMMNQEDEESKSDKLLSCANLPCMDKLREELSCAIEILLGKTENLDELMTAAAEEREAADAEEQG